MYHCEELNELFVTKLLLDDLLEVDILGVAVIEHILIDPINSNESSKNVLVRSEYRVRYLPFVNELGVDLQRPDEAREHLN